MQENLFKIYGTRNEFQWKQCKNLVGSTQHKII